jgi:hypothetical protein
MGLFESKKFSFLYTYHGAHAAMPGPVLSSPRTILVIRDHLPIHFYTFSRCLVPGRRTNVTVSRNIQDGRASSALIRPRIASFISLGLLDGILGFGL